MAVDWSNKTLVTSAPTGAHEANTILSITGSGYLMGVWMGRNSQFSIEIDGTIYQADTLYNNPGGESDGHGNINRIRFESNFVVKSNLTIQSRIAVWAVTD